MLQSVLNQCDSVLNSLCKLEAGFEPFVKKYESSGCPSGWEYFENSCYKIYNFAMNYYQAQAYCPAQEESSYLADITSNSEFSWIRSFFQANANGDVWVHIYNL